MTTFSALTMPIQIILSKLETISKKLKLMSDFTKNFWLLLIRIEGTQAKSVPDIFPQSEMMAQQSNYFSVLIEL